MLGLPGVTDPPLIYEHLQHAMGMLSGDGDMESTAMIPQQVCLHPFGRPGKQGRVELWLSKWTKTHIVQYSRISDAIPIPNE